MKYCRHYQTECQWEGNCDITPCRCAYTFDDGENYRDVNQEDTYDSSRGSKEKN